MSQKFVGSYYIERHKDGESFFYVVREILDYVGRDYILVKDVWYACPVEDLSRAEFDSRATVTTIKNAAEYWLDWDNELFETIDDALRAAMAGEVLQNQTATSAGD